MPTVIGDEWLRERCYARARRSVPEARAFAARAFADWGLGPRTDDAVLCVSELATNAVRHGVPPGRAFRLRLYQYGDDSGTVRIEVHDSGPGWPRTRSSPHGADAEDGRGLLLVAALADKWGVDERNPGKVVWVTLGASRC
ncbi:ATP-binding protein [Streptomyces niger]|uniref:ATP-binding protein n=1 Tax=Streptomyces niger TaxID=66373 RepID=UPI000DA63AB1|nr:ATP-binding protein [Streptomyces niger]